jgi:hypothetical protein
MLEEAREPSTRARSRMRRVVGVATVLFWASAALMTVLVVLFWVATGLRDERSLNLLGGMFVGLAMVSSSCCYGKSCAPTGKRSATFGGRGVTSPWTRARSGPLKRGSTLPPSASPFFSRGTCCQPCSSPPEQATSPEGDADRYGSAARRIKACQFTRVRGRYSQK